MPNSASANGISELKFPYLSFSDLSRCARANLDIPNLLYYFNSKFAKCLYAHNSFLNEVKDIFICQAAI